MKQQETLTEELFERAENFGKTTVELYRLKAIDKMAAITSSIASGLALIVIAGLFFLIVNIGLAFWMGEILGKLYFGFFVVAGFYAVLGVLLYVFREKWIKTPVSNSIIEQAIKE